MLDALPFQHIVAVDTEFHFGGHDTKEAADRAGERPHPVCVVAKELRSGQTWRIWQDSFGPQPPFPLDDTTVLVAHYASAECGAFRALGWPQPTYILDTFTEYRARTNGMGKPAGLLDAAAHFGLPVLETGEKDAMRSLILKGGPWTAEEQAATISYCENDVLALEALLPCLLPKIDLPRALLRGRFMRAAAAVEWNGIPMDLATLDLLRRHWLAIQDELIATIDRDYNVFEGRSFRQERWERWLIDNDIPWPRLETGQLALDDGTFRNMAKIYPKVSPMRELRSSLSEMRLNNLAVGSDARNRTILSAFASRTGRCQPSNTRYIFGPSVWLRSLIKPAPGWGVAYLDWSQQEFAIAAVLSGDKAMLHAYLSGDTYLEFGKQAGKLPADATKVTHGPERALFKQCVLGVGYGMGEFGLAERIGRPRIEARHLLRAHRETYQRFWEWSDAIADHGMLLLPLSTVLGWPLHGSANPNPRSLRNFPCQANGAEMLRLAACFATEEGIEVCAVVHDALMIAAPLERLEADIERMRAAMDRASAVVLGGFVVRVGVHVTRYPDRYFDDDGRGTEMWNQVMALVAKREAAAKEVA